MIFVGKHRGRPVARIASVAAVLGIVLLGGCGAGLPDPKCHEIGYRLYLGVATLGMSELIGECVDTPPRLGWLEELKARAEQSDPDAQYRLALVTLDPDEKWKWTCLAANQSYPIAQRQIAFWYRDVADRHWPTLIQHTDNAKAHMWYALAASNGDEGSANSRDQLEETMPPDQIAESERLFAEWEPDPVSCEATAVSSNYVPATIAPYPKSDDHEVHLKAHYSLEGNERYRRLCLSANGGNPRAQFELGRLNWYGDELYDEDRVAGYMWFRISANQGFISSKVDLANLGRALAPDQLDQVSRLVAEWKPDPILCEIEGTKSGKTG